MGVQNPCLLSKDEFPIFAVHPDNLVPICETCNSKAKLAKSLITKKQKDRPDERRFCIFPFVENCADYVGVEVVQDELGLTAKFTMDLGESTDQEKLNTWNEVYCIQGRVEGKFSDLAVIADNDCHASDLNEFKQRIQAKAVLCKANCRLESWNFWKYRLYEWLDVRDDGVSDSLWKGIIAKRADVDAAEVYGI